MLPGAQRAVAVKPMQGPSVVAVSREAAPIAEQSMAMLRKAIWEKGVDGMSPVQLAPVNAIHVDEIKQNDRGES